MKRFIPSPAMLVAVIALFVAMGGTGYAAVTLKANSVGSAQIKNHSVRQIDLAPVATIDSKTKTYVKRAALDAVTTTLEDPPANLLIKVQGEKGDKGDSGTPSAVPGPQGPPTLPTVNLRQQSITVNPSETGSLTVPCTGNERVTGGGFVMQGDVDVLSDGPVDQTAWQARVTNQTPDVQTLVVSSICTVVS